MLVGTINFTGLHVADLDGDGRDDLLIAGTDRFGVLQTGRKGQRLKTIATYESKRNEARLGRPGRGRRQRRRTPDVVFSDVGEQSLEIATYAGDPELVAGHHIQDLRTQELSATPATRSNRATWRSATWTATAGPTSSWSSTTASWSCARTREASETGRTRRNRCREAEAATASRSAAPVTLDRTCIVSQSAISGDVGLKSGCDWSDDRGDRAQQMTRVETSALTLTDESNRAIPPWRRNQDGP